MSADGHVRRRTLLAGSVSFCLGFAGCSSVPEESADPRTNGQPPLDGIWLWNFYQVSGQTERADEKIEPLLRVERNGAVVHRETYTLPDDGRNRVVVSDSEWMGCGRYEVATRVRGESGDATLDSRDLDPPEVRDGEVRPYRIDIGYHPKLLEIGPVYLDEWRSPCETTMTGTEAMDG